VKFQVHGLGPYMLVWDEVKKGERILLNTFYEANITLIPNPKKDTTRRKTTGQYLK
jgi:hypothetical protein